uniref:Uncharacterized protein n=1 Tax=Bionectria ochroleuca TaxID=29856 RepID=A0A8H7TR25_BIOOC
MHIVLYINLVILGSYPHSNYQLVDKYLCKSRKKPPNLDQKPVLNRGMRETVCIPFIYLSLRKRETPNPLQLPPDEYLLIQYVFILISQCNINEPLKTPPPYLPSPPL